jgi:subtilisin family serine protease
MDAVSYPARIASSLAVGAATGAGHFCTFSNRGEGLDLSTLGCDIRGSAFDGNVGSFAGTSYSSPVVTAALAALRAYRPDLSADAAEQILLDSAKITPVGRELDVVAAFRRAGLASLVESYSRPAPTETSSSSATGASVGPASIGSGTVRVIATTHWTNASATRPPTARPVLRRLSFHGRRLRVELRNPPRNVDVIFRVDSRTYRRSRGLLVLRVGAWRHLTVSFEDAWGRRSAMLRVNQRGGLGNSVPQREG